MPRACPAARRGDSHAKPCPPCMLHCDIQALHSSMSQQMSQQPASSSSSSSSSSSALVSTRQRPAVHKLLSMALTSRRLADLKTYLARGGDANALAYYSKNEDAWYADPADCLVAGELPAAPLLTSCCGANLREHVLALLDAGADVNGGGNEFTPLYSASGRNRQDIIEVLLSRGALVDIDNGAGTALAAACTGGHLEAVRVLVAAGANPHFACRTDEDEACTAMTLAIHQARLSVLQLFKASGASIQFSLGEQRDTALHCLSEDTTAACIRWLMDCGCSVHAKNSEEQTPLHVAARESNSAALTLFIAAGAEIDARAANGQTALNFAASNDDAACLVVLLRAGADPFVTSGGRFAAEPLIIAVIRDASAAVRMLVNSSAFRSDSRAQVVIGRALREAASYGHADCLAALITSKTWKEQLQAHREAGESMLLHLGSTVGVIEEIVRHKSDLQAMLHSRVPDTGYSVMHSAVRRKRSVQVICRLLKLGADPLAVGNDGQTPADLARARGQTLIAQLLDRAAQDTQQQRA